MAGKPTYSYPSDEDILEGVRVAGGISQYARTLRIDPNTLRHQLHKRGLIEKINELRETRLLPLHGQPPPKERTPQEKPSFTVKGDTAVLVTEPSPTASASDVEELMRSRGLDPAEWITVTVTVNEWDAMTSPVDGENRIVKMRQLKVGLKRRISLMLVSPAVHVPKVARIGKITPGDPEYVVVESDHQAPYHDPRLHAASLALLGKLQPHEHVFLGDTGDYPTISRFRDHPAAMASVNDVNQAAYEILRDKAEASPDSRRRKLKGNHDYRVEAELLTRAERMYGIRAADTGDGEQLPALSLRRLLHLDALGIELVEDVRGWEHAEIELVPGQRGLVARHGWITGFNTARRSMEKRGRSIIVGHTHQPEHTFRWDPSAECRREAAVIGAMCTVRGQGKDFPHFVPTDGWLQGFGVVSRWADGRFAIEHVRWDGGVLTWRNERFGA